MNKIKLVAKFFPILLFFFQAAAWAQTVAVDDAVFARLDRGANAFVFRNDTKTFSDSIRLIDPATGSAAEGPLVLVAGGGGFEVDRYSLTSRNTRDRLIRYNQPSNNSGFIGDLAIDYVIWQDVDGDNIIDPEDDDYTDVAVLAGLPRATLTLSVVDEIFIKDDFQFIYTDSCPTITIPVYLNDGPRLSSDTVVLMNPATGLPATGAVTVFGSDEVTVIGTYEVVPNIHPATDTSRNWDILFTPDAAACTAIELSEISDQAEIVYIVNDANGITVSPFNAKVVVKLLPSTTTQGVIKYGRDAVTGSTTVVVEGNQVDWIINYDTQPDISLSNVFILDDYSDNQTVTLADPAVPPNWDAVDNGDSLNISKSDVSSPPTGDSTGINIPGTVNLGNAGGDGWAPILGADDGNIYMVFHHRAARNTNTIDSNNGPGVLMCVDPVAGTICDGYVVDPNAATKVPTVTLLPNGEQTKIGHKTDNFYIEGNRLYYTYSLTPTNSYIVSEWGLGCFDVSAYDGVDPLTGNCDKDTNYPGSLWEDGAIVLGSSPPSPTVSQQAGDGIAGPVLGDDGNIYVLDYFLIMHCLQSDGTPCAVTGTDLSVDPGLTPLLSGYAEMQKLGDRIYAYTINGSTDPLYPNLVMASCWDTTTQSACWPATPFDDVNTFSISNVWFRYDQNNMPDAVCVYGNGASTTDVPTGCVTLSGQSIVDDDPIYCAGYPGGCTRGVPADLIAALPTIGTNQFGGGPGVEFYLDGNTYFPMFFTDEVLCWDWSEAAGGTDCSGFGTDGITTGPSGSEVYATALEEGGRCAWVLGDNNFLWSYGVDTGETPCRISTTELEVDPTDFYCGTKPVFDPLVWSTFTLESADWGIGTGFDVLATKFASLTLEFIDIDSAQVIATYDMLTGQGDATPMITYDVAQTRFKLDISGAPWQDVYPLSVRLVSSFISGQDFTDIPVMALNFEGPPVEFCLTALAPPATCSPLTEITNSAYLYDEIDTLNPPAVSGGVLSDTNYIDSSDAVLTVIPTNGLTGCSDYGDNPEIYGDPKAGVYLLNDLLGSVDPTDVYLGALVPDPEVLTQYSVGADGDDLDSVDGTPVVDDEDGVAFILDPAPDPNVLTMFTAGSAYNIPVTITNNQGLDANGVIPVYLNAWVDWNNDGDFNDAGETIATENTLGSGTTGTGSTTFNLTGTVPVDATGDGGTGPSQVTYARFIVCDTIGECISPTASMVTTGEVEDYPLAIKLPDIDVSKAVSGTPTDNGDGTWTVTYTVTAENTGGSAGTYDLTESIEPGAGITVNATTAPTIVYDAANTDGQTGTITSPFASGDTVVTGEDLKAGGTETWTVTVVFDVDPAAVAAAGSGECTDLADATGGGGFTNIIDTNDTTDDETNDEACAPLPEPDIEVSKALSGTPTDNGDGTWTVMYTVTAANTGAGPGSYDLMESIEPGAGITVNATTAPTIVYDAANTDGQTGTITSPFASGDTVVTGEDLKAGGTETWTVTVVFDVDPAAVAAAGSGECTDLADATGGGGFTNIIDTNDTTDDETNDEACAPLPEPDIEVSKALSGTPTDNGDGTWTVMYTVTAANTGAGPGSYDLMESIEPGTGITVNATTAPTIVYDAANTDGQTGTITSPFASGDTVVTGEDLKAGGTETWTVTVVFDVDPAAVAAAGSGECTDLADATGGGGFTNIIDTNDTTDDETNDEACAPLPEPDIEVSKALSGTPTDNGDGTWTVMYTVTAANTGAGPGSYDLMESIEPGTGITVNATTAPTTVYDAANTDGQTGTITSPFASGDTVVTGEDLKAGGTETWTVTVVFDVDPAAVAAAGSGECTDLADATGGGGFTNIIDTNDTTDDETNDEACAPVPVVSVSGNVFNDADGLNDGQVDGLGIGEPGGTPLYATLVDDSGNVVQSVPVAVDGTFTFDDVVAEHDYTVQIGTVDESGNVGSAPAAPDLPTGWVNTGEDCCDNTGDDGTVDGIVPVSVGTEDVTEVNLGIEQPPTANDVTAPSQANPGGTTQVTVPPLDVTDPEDGVPTTIVIETLPDPTTEGVLYYNGVPVTAGQVIPNFDPTLLTVDPVDGDVTVVFTYSTIDAAGEQSDPATVTMPFTGLDISGNVFNDADGLNDGQVDGLGIGEPGGTPLYATLVDDSGNVVQSVAVAADGTYTFANVEANTDYTVQLGTVDESGNVGSAPAAPDLPTGWVNTGEDCCDNTGDDGTVDGIVPVSVGTEDVTEVNLGIEQPPTANDVTAPSQANPGGTTQVTVPPLDVTDPEDGVPTTIVIETLPDPTTEGVLYYNGVPVTAGQVIPNFDPTLLTVDPVDGDVTVDFTYSTIDAAGEQSDPATVTMPFTGLDISGNVFNDADGLNDGQVDGLGIGEPGGTPLYATLVDDSGNVVQSVAVAADGTYTFANVEANTDYTVQLGTVDESGNVGSAPAAPDLPTGWVNTGEDCCDNTGDDGTVDGIVPVSVGTEDVTEVNLGIEQPPTANDVTAPSQANPGGTTQVTVPPLDVTDPEDGVPTTIVIETLPDPTTEGVLYYNGVPVTAGQVIPNFDPTLLTVDPVDGDVTVDFTYSTIDAAGEQSDPATVTMPFTGLDISGNVFNDADGLNDGQVDGLGIGEPGGTPLYATLVDDSGNVVQSVAVAADGTYTFANVEANTDYTVQLGTVDESGNVGSAPAAPDLPTGWVNTGEDCCDNTGDDGTVDGIVPVSVGTEDVTEVNLGIEQPPTANDVTAPSQANPGGTTQVTVPPLDVTDPEDGVPTTIVIETLPDPTTEGVLYYNGVPVTAGQVIPNFDPTLLTVDPVDGDVTVVFTYSTIDAAGEQSDPATVTMPFTGLDISGNVFNDADGLNDGQVDGLGIGEPGGTPLYATLVDDSGNVVQSVAVAADGTYTFANVEANTDYTVQLGTVDESGNVGSAPAAPDLPTGWVNTGEDCCDNTGDDGTVDGIVPVSVGTEDVTEVNLGIEQPPTANDVTAPSQANPGGTTQVTVPPLDVTDPEDGVPTTIVIETLPDPTTEGVLYYNGVPVTAGQVIPNFDPTLLTVDPVDGDVTVDFTYSTIDAAGEQSDPATVTMPFTGLDISGNVFNDADGLNDGQVDGLGIGEPGGTPLYATLVDDSGNVVQSVAVAADGTYTFANVEANTDYTVQLGTVDESGNVGSAPAAPDLPTGWVNTGEDCCDNTGDDGTVDGIVPVSVGTEDVTEVNLGIEQPPTANDVTAPSQANPGGTTQVTVPPLDVTDPEDGVPTTIVIETLPDPTTEGVLYYNGVPVTAGQVIPNFDPTLLTVDPVDGDVTVDFTYSTIDAAGEQSDPATVTMPFTGLDISGNVFNDADG